MHTTDIFCQLKRIPISSIGHHYNVVPLGDMDHKLGSSEEGYPKFFISAIIDKNYLRNLNAELLSVEYDVSCDVIEGDNEICGKIYTIITLRSEDEQLQRTFLEVFLLMLKSLPPIPSKGMIAGKVETLLSIFAQLKHKPLHKIQGLWTELLLISQSSDPETVAKAWHSNTNSKYDFTLGRDKIEVKSTSSENRIHHFSLDQLLPTENSILLICSVIVRESGKSDEGLSVFDLYDRISKQIYSDEVRMHVYETMINTLGSDFLSADKKYFDSVSALDSLAFYNSVDIPKISKNSVPEFVSEVKFSVDISHVCDIKNNLTDYIGEPLFQAIF